jgi:hypothetical protein
MKNGTRKEVKKKRKGLTSKKNLRGEKFLYRKKDFNLNGK